MGLIIFHSGCSTQGYFNQNFKSVVQKALKSNQHGLGAGSRSSERTRNPSSGPSGSSLWLETRLSPPDKEPTPRSWSARFCSKMTAHLAAAGPGAVGRRGPGGMGEAPAEKGKEGHPSALGEEIPGAQLPGAGQRVT